MTGDTAQTRAPGDDAEEPRRRFRRRGDRLGAGVADGGEALSALHAELVLLREETRG